MPVLSNLEDLEASAPEALHRRPGLLALDVSKRAIGVAGADPTWQIATPLTTIRRRRWADDVAALRAVVAERAAELLIVGWPLNMDGTEGPRCQAVRAFTDALDAALHPVILLWDERLSTFAAEERVGGRRMAGKKARGDPGLDALAAAAILEDFLNALARRRARSG